MFGPRVRLKCNELVHLAQRSTSVRKRASLVGYSDWHDLRGNDGLVLVFNIELAGDICEHAVHLRGVNFFLPDADDQDAPEALLPE